MTRYYSIGEIRFEITECECAKFECQKLDAPPYNIKVSIFKDKNRKDLFINKKIQSLEEVKDYIDNISFDQFEQWITDNEKYL